MNELKISMKNTQKPPSKRKRVKTESGTVGMWRENLTNGTKTSRTAPELQHGGPNRRRSGSFLPFDKMEEALITVHS